MKKAAPKKRAPALSRVVGDLQLQLSDMSANVRYHAAALAKLRESNPATIISTLAYLTTQAEQSQRAIEALENAVERLEVRFDKLPIATPHPPESYVYRDCPISIRSNATVTLRCAA